MYAFSKRKLLAWAGGGLIYLTFDGLGEAAAATWPSGSAPRIASFDWGLTECLLALGVPPVAVVSATDWSRFVVEPALPDGIVDLGLPQEVNFELLAALDPDLILTSPFLQNLEPKLSTIAEVLRLSVYDPGDTPLGQRQMVMRALGDRLDMQAAAEQYISHADAVLENVRDRVSGFADESFLFVTFLDPRHLRVYGPPSLFQNVLDRIGLRNAWTKPTGYFGYATVGVEALADTGASQLVSFQPVPPDVATHLLDSPLWTELPFFRSDRQNSLPPVLMFGGLPAALRFARLLADALESGQR